MYIKSVVIHGFKTFANKTHIEFGRGVSSVIGPNGCGKSNIIDSIRWVLGEQSAKSLRGGEMTDVISNGNRKRKPSNLCDVTIVLDNEDKALAIDNVEVAIRRKLFRSGESEYHINGEPARLKDIRELFMDTGIGAKTNTVIEQEQLTKLLQASSKERKVMIEEAAGISRFRQRRQESALKLDRVKENMTRLNDIVTEVDKQKRSVATQASKATRYESMQKELRKTKLNVAVMQLHGWIGERMTIERKRDAFNVIVETSKQKEGTLQAELQALETKEIEIEEVMAKLQEEQAGFFREYAEVENAIKDNRTRIEVLEKDIATLEAEIERFQQELKVSKEKAEGSEPQQEAGSSGNSELDDLDQAIHALRAKVEQLNLDIQARKTALARSQNWEIEMIREKSHLQNELIKVESHLEFLNRRLKQVVEKETELEAKDPESESQEQVDEVVLRQAKEAEAEKAELGGKIVTIRHQLKELEGELRMAVSLTSGKRSRLSLLKEMEEKFEGVGAGVRNILDIYVKQHPDELYPGGVHGVVADLITVPEQYVDALEAALGPRMQNVVFSTAQEAKDAIYFLRKNNFGRATMLPLDRIHPRSKLEGRVLNYPGVKGEAINLVAFDGQYNRLFSHLLNGTLVVDTMDHALSISRDHKVRIVTLEGDLISPEGAMTGGAKGKDAGILSRKAEIEDLEGSLAESESDQRSRMSQHESLLNREEKTQRQLQIVDARLKEMEDKLRMAQQKKAVAEREVLRIRQEKVITRREKENLLQQIADGQAEVDRKKGTLNALTQRPQEAATQEDKDQLEALERDRHESQAQLQERELKKVSLLERSQSAQREKEYLLEKIAELEERLQRRHKIISERSVELDDRRLKLTKDEARFSELEHQKNTQQSHFFEMKTQRDEMRARRGVIQKEALENSEGLRKSEHELTNLAVSEERLRVKQEELFNRIHGEFHVNIEDVYFNMRQAEDPLFAEEENFAKVIEESHQRIIELDQKLSSLGNVNFEAVEELKGIEERENELKGQMGDLTDAFKKLDTLIKELDQKCNEMFKETFDKVNDHFTMMFRRLFSGGQGRLIMEKDVNPLEAGITISASPPGKAPKVLSQLSGGEKVLTTIAFLFAIFLYKPSPFCILDEIDAPLDEHNVDRLMEAIRSFTDRCQFLVVTHNRRTMSLSDVIHGVTMQETGISNCMTIDLNNLEFNGQEFVPINKSTPDSSDEPVASTINNDNEESV
jgi:chromosome segregation protein